MLFALFYTVYYIENSPNRLRFRFPTFLTRGHKTLTNVLERESASMRMGLGLDSLVGLVGFKVLFYVI